MSIPLALALAALVTAAGWAALDVIDRREAAKHARQFG